MNKSKYLGVTCVRHVIQHCGGYLLDSLGPPVPPTLGMTTLMVLREAVINGEVRRIKMKRILPYFTHRQDSNYYSVFDSNIKGPIVKRMIKGAMSPYLESF